VALFVEGADRVTFRMNQVERNGWAVRILGSSQDNHFTANNFVENTFDVTTNARRSDNTFEGNYWSAYRGYDLAGDGFGDVPHRPVRLFSSSWSGSRRRSSCSGASSWTCWRWRSGCSRS
jgi:nitrous oxidase accessory protein